jgi:hypothetical protein
VLDVTARHRWAYARWWHRVPLQGGYSLDGAPWQGEPRSRSKKALAGEIKNFTGVDDAYEAPEHPALVLDTMVETPEQSLRNLLTRLRELGYIEDATVMVEGDRVHSGQTDLRLTDTGHVAGGR